MSSIRVLPLGTRALTLRRLICQDLPQVARLARLPRQAPWMGQDSLLALQPESRLGWVVETAHRLAGFILCTVSRLGGAPPASGVLPALTGFFRGLLGLRIPEPLQVKLVDLRVSDEWPRAAVERALLEQLEAELRRRGGRIHMVVPESSLTAQLFLHEVEYRATRVLRGYYGSEDGYLMVSPLRAPVRRPGRMPSLTNGGVSGTV